jgi:hypothetical protein
MKRSETMTRLRELGAILLIGVLAAGCRSVSIYGVIQTSAEEPIAKATLTLEAAQTGAHALTGASDLNGCFNLFETISRRHGDYILVVDLAGYKPLRVPVAAGPDNLLLITMAPEVGAGPSSVRPISSSERYMRYTTPCEPLIHGSSLTLH